MANVDKCPLLTGTIFPFEMIPTKFDKFFPMVNKIILEILKKQCGKLQEFYPQGLVIFSRNLGEKRTECLNIIGKT